MREEERTGIVYGQRMTFTHRDPATGRYWTDDFGKWGGWVDSNKITFDAQAKQPQYKKSVRRCRK